MVMRNQNVPADRLLHPRDVKAWQSWQDETHTLRQARNRVMKLVRGTLYNGDPRKFVPLHLTVRGEHPSILLAVDATTPTQIASILKPLAELQDTDVAIISVTCMEDSLRSMGEQVDQWNHTVVNSTVGLPEQLRGIRAAVGVGHYLPAGSLAYRWSLEADAKFVVVQHGLLTPYAPPLPEGAHLAAFSAEDAQFYTSGRSDITWEVTGSQLLWEASQPAHRLAPGSTLGKPVFLGQLHGAELPRSEFAKAATTFCSMTGGFYRPHPGERDKISRAQHAVWQSSGIALDRSNSPLTTLKSPVASVFSTGILEAAARGLPARVTHSDPPAWVQAFWERYGMVRWNGTVQGAGAADDAAPITPAPWVPSKEPSLAISEMLGSLVGVTESCQGTPSESEGA